MAVALPDDALDRILSEALKMLADGSVAAALRLLDDIYAGDGSLEHALNCADRGLVTRQESPSGRCVHTVRSTISAGAGRRGDVAVSGTREGSYICLGGSCSCLEYRARILVVEDRQLQRLCCKHILAVRVAEAARRCLVRAVNDAELDAWTAVLQSGNEAGAAGR